MMYLQKKVKGGKHAHILICPYTICIASCSYLLNYEAIYVFNHIHTYNPHKIYVLSMYYEQ